MVRVVFTDKAPRPVGPYSQAVITDNTVYCSGQIGLDPCTGKLIGDRSQEQARQCLLNLEAVLKEAGASLSNIVKTTIFVTEMGDFKEVNEVYATFFAINPPARSTIGVAKLPMGAKVEIEAVATLE